MSNPLLFSVNRKHEFFNGDSKFSTFRAELLNPANIASIPRLQLQEYTPFRNNDKLDSVTYLKNIMEKQLPPGIYKAKFITDFNDLIKLTHDKYNLSIQKINNKIFIKSYSTLNNNKIEISPNYQFNDNYVYNFPYSCQALYVPTEGTIEDNAM